MDDIDQLAIQLEKYNQAYRSGQPLISDAAYDRLVEELRRRDPQHPFLNTVEPEQFASRREVRHPVPMLSIEKVYLENGFNGLWRVPKKRLRPWGSRICCSR